MLDFLWKYGIIIIRKGDIAHLVERYVRNVQVTCSSHAISTIKDKL